MEVILVFLLAMSLSIGYFYLKKNRNIKSSVVKKEEIIEMYKEQMTKVIRDNQNNTKVQREEKRHDGDEGQAPQADEVSKEDGQEIEDDPCTR